ncbi:hypothetical protein [Marinitenerispora sediminis]|uniref:TetR family transcriptional regulator n=1 Tax=Marinitenerispora sediminis TaxID=1931232 RepID=A0A368T1M0_9ACTN|nr:hypothetical protein [Marinitenerispora sediminis]RCV51567.1 hypothetical protein DEF28_15200 [Marinitenerispora sediminis]RCV54447.1 hypothetical protein DEF24_19250 [Marinitenerispora sediminis]RCV55640.1 hypothetical protein DEF23_13995 [Marinitenerispora sediminis]
MIRRAPLIGRRLAEALRTTPSAAALAELMRQMSTVLTTDPFYRRLVTHPDELAPVSRRVGAEEVARVTPPVLAPLLGSLAAGQRAGVIVADVPPDVVVGVLRTAGLVVMNRQRYGDGYAQVLDAVITALARGLTTSGGD